MSTAMSAQQRHNAYDGLEVHAPAAHSAATVDAAFAAAATLRALMAYTARYGLLAYGPGVTVVLAGLNYLGQSWSIRRRRDRSGRATSW